MTHVIFKVDDITCENCTARIEKMIGQLEGVKSVIGSVDDKTVNIDFNSDVLTNETLIEELGDLGFDAVVA